jgi:hypothetical protein
MAVILGMDFAAMQWFSGVVNWFVNYHMPVSLTMDMGWI